MSIFVRCHGDLTPGTSDVRARYVKRRPASLDPLGYTKGLCHKETQCCSATIDRTANTLLVWTHSKCDDPCVSLWDTQWFFVSLSQRDSVLLCTSVWVCVTKRLSILCTYVCEYDVRQDTHLHMWQDITPNVWASSAPISHTSHILSHIILTSHISHLTYHIDTHRRRGCSVSMWGVRCEMSIWYVTRYVRCEI